MSKFPLIDLCASTAKPVEECSALGYRLLTVTYSPSEFQMLENALESLSGRRHMLFAEGRGFAIGIPREDYRNKRYTERVATKGIRINVDPNARKIIHDMSGTSQRSINLACDKFQRSRGVPKMSFSGQVVAEDGDV